MKYIFLFIIFAFSHLAKAQNIELPDHKIGQFIIKFRDDVDANQVISRWQSMRSDLTIANTIPEFQYYVLQYEDVTLANEQAMLQDLRKQNEVQLVTLNHKLKDRSDDVPNDAFYATKQWNMPLINAPEVWKTTTGGTSACGDTVVVAILEISGYDMKHEDLVSNIFINRKEIAGNNKDDDGNGYIDDVNGWNVKAKNGTQFANIHGTIVAGIVGAKGNNTTGVTGVNQRVKMLLVSGMQYEDEILGGYAYVLKMRQLYNTSKGKSGAYVVVTNTSLGIDNAQPEDHIIWCEVYDKLGAESVISVAATTNSGNSNIDVDGDVPSACTSPFLITVTNSDKTDTKLPGAGFGPKTIDLAAPGGGDFWTTSLSSKYAGVGATGGTSYASPHVAGAIGLLYSLKSDKICSSIKSDPLAYAKLMKKVILDGAKPIATMAGKSVTGGRLDVGGSYVLLRNQFGNKGSNLGLTLFPNPAQNICNILYTTPDSESYDLQVANTLGQVVYQSKFNSQPFGQQIITISTEQYAKGLYLVSIKGANTKFVTQKLFVNQ